VSGRAGPGDVIIDGIPVRQESGGGAQLGRTSAAGRLIEADGGP